MGVPPMAKVAVIGAGSWGTALSLVLADNGHDVLLYGREEDHVLEINTSHTNSTYLKDAPLPESIRATTDLKEAIAGRSIIFLVVPSSAIRPVSRELNTLLKEPAVIVHAAKGIEPKTHKRLSEIIAEEIDPSKRRAIGVLTGPTHAEEVAVRKLTTITIACEDLDVADEIQELLTNDQFRVYLNSDVIGAEYGGALKNIIALAAGMTDGLGYGDNAKAALMTRGIVEIARLGVRLGANPASFSGLTGIGDLIVTATSQHSRNWRAGNAIGRGEKLEDVLGQMGMVVEGVRACEAAHTLAGEAGVEMPITEALYNVLFENKSPHDEVKKLMRRPQKHEMEQVFHFEGDEMARD